MDCWCLDVSQQITKDRVHEHLRTLSFDDVMAHSIGFSDYQEWCERRGIFGSASDRIFESQVCYNGWGIVLSEICTVMHICMHAAGKTESQLRNACMALSKMRLNYEWNLIAQNTWYNLNPVSLPPELLALISSFVGVYGRISFDDLNGLPIPRYCMATKLSYYLKHLQWYNNNTNQNN